MAMVIADNHPAANANSAGSVSDDNTTGILITTNDTGRKTTNGQPVVTPERRIRRFSLSDGHGAGTNGCADLTVEPSSDTPTPDDPPSPDDRLVVGTSSDGCRVLAVFNGAGATTAPAAGLLSDTPSLAVCNGTGTTTAPTAGHLSDTPSPDHPPSPDDRRDVGTSTDAGCRVLAVRNGKLDPRVQWKFQSGFRALHRNFLSSGLHLYPGGQLNWFFSYSRHITTLQVKALRQFFAFELVLKSFKGFRINIQYILYLYPGMCLISDS